MEKAFVQRTGALPDRPGTSAGIAENVVDGKTPAAVVDETTTGALTVGTAGATTL
jgi:hypothetical protein